MRDFELYAKLLDLAAPWTVARVEVHVRAQRVDVWVEHTTAVRWPCPECHRRLFVYDHAPMRTWRHLDRCRYQTFVHARPPRVCGPRHGVHQVRVPWAEPHARYTVAFECTAIEVLRAASVKEAAHVLTFCTHHVTNAVAEGLNDVVATIQKRAYGFRSFDHFYTAVLFHCGGLELVPPIHKNLR